MTFENLSKLPRIIVSSYLFPLILLTTIIFTHIYGVDDISVSSGNSIINIDVVKLKDALILFFAAVIFIRIKQFVLWDKVFPNIIGRKPPKLLIQFINFVIYLITLSIILSVIYGYSVTNLWAASGAAGVVIALALRNLIMDTFSGLAIQLESPFKNGDWISLHTRAGIFIGRVEDTNWRTTCLWHPNREKVIIPNSLLTTNIIANMTGNDPVSRFELVFTLDNNVAYEKVVGVLSSALLEATGPKGPLSEPSFKIRADNIIDDGINYKVRYYLNTQCVSPAKARNTIIACVQRHLNMAGIKLSHTKMDIYTSNKPHFQKNWTSKEDRTELLSSISLLKGLKKEEVEIIAQNSSLIQMNKNDFLIHQGKKESTMYILVEGLVDVLVEQPDRTPLKVATLSPGAFFGEKSLLTGVARSASIQCATNSLVCQVSKPAMQELFSSRPHVAEILSNTITQRDLDNQSRFTQLSEEQKQKMLEQESLTFFKKLQLFINF